MYCDFYGMRERPFNVTADPKFLYLNARYREALASLHYGVTQRKGFITLIGEAGTGKTTLLKKLLNDLDPNTRTVFVFNTNVTFDEILEYIFAEFDLPVHNGKRLYMLQRLNAFLLDELREGRNVALLVDEAQDLDYSVMEDLRLLSNLETSKEKILQIVLAGQPELGQKLTNPSLRQLRQRVAVNCRLMPLTREELSEYIQSRLSSAGCTDPQLFSRDAVERVYEISAGIPRIVNVVCDNALVIGYAMGKKRLGAEIIDEAAADLIATEGAPEVMAATAGARPAGVDVPRSRWLSPRGLMAVVAAALLIGLASVGRTLWKDGFPIGDGGARELEVVQPGISDSYPALDSGRQPIAPVQRPEVAERRPLRAYPEYVRPGEKLDPLGGRYDSRQAGDGALGAVGMGDLSEPQEAPYPAPRLAEPAPVDGAGAAVDAAGSARAAAPPPQVAALPAPAEEAERQPLEAAVAEPEPASERPAWDDLGDPAVEIDVPLAEPPPAAAVAEPEPEGPVRMRLALNRYEYVQVVPEDSISEIAIRHYGQASPTILDLMKMANPKVRDINHISPGQTLRLPQLDQGLVLLKQSDGQYGLMLISLSSRGRAEEIRSALRRQGFGARVSPAELGGASTVWRVIIGDLESREVALEVGSDLQQLFRRDRRISALAQP
jgi:type II secretory pathway predicted ATPase ExeA/nucleoid-associated protein YgaU